MPIRINGTTVTNNSVNGTSISSETVNRTQVYEGAGPRVWTFYAINSSDPSANYKVNNYNSTVSSTNPHWLEIAYPASNYPNGTTGTIYYAVPREYAIFVVRSS